MGPPVSESKNQVDTFPPEAASLAESLRAFSYELPSALADLIDNSITAGARTIWIDFHWAGAESVIAVTDDGLGMEESALRAAMRLGSQNPRALRAPHDLGRFGLGLKTASFSHCRRLTVRSRMAGQALATRCWDLDHLLDVNRWEMLCEADDEAEPHLARLRGLPHGTAVVWQKLDHLCAGQHTSDERHHQLFLQRVRAVGKHIALVFHQLISGTGGVRIHLNGSESPVEPWDPFLADEPATQRFPPTRLRLHGQVIEVEPFVLPHHSRLTQTRHEQAGGVHGWNAHQGFYVYRGRRLLVAGDWLGFGWTKEEHYKLARIRVELPNSLDLDWALDVTKSRALPPPSLRHDLRGIAEVTREKAKQVFTHRGAKLTRHQDGAPVLLWEPIAKHNKAFYRLNREHPLVRQALVGASNRDTLGALLRLIEETVPFPHITIQNSERPESLPTPFEGTAASQVLDVMRKVLAALRSAGHAPPAALSILATMHPFGAFPDLLQVLREEQSDD